MRVRKRTKGDGMDLKNKSRDELLKLAKEKGIELSDEQLDRVSGGVWASNPDCPTCGSADVVWDDCLGLLICRSCGCEFY